MYFLHFLSHLTGRQSQSSSKPSDQNKMRRAAEREGRRARRRKHREKEKKTSQPDTHHEGQSTDDEETETDAIKFRAETSNFLCYYIQARSSFPQHPINELIIYKFHLLVVVNFRFIYVSKVISHTR